MKIGRQEDRKTGRQENRKTRRQEVLKIGRQEDRKAGRQEDRMKLRTCQPAIKAPSSVNDGSASRTNLNVFLLF